MFRRRLDGKIDRIGLSRTHWSRASWALRRSRSGNADGRENHRGRALNPVQRHRERGTVAVIWVQVIDRGLCDLESDRFADDEGHGFRLELTRVTRRRAVVNWISA
ncbi:MAG TPA: hypothetical protein VF836_06180 [Gemmatimonadaceae bacterium]